MNRAPGVLLCAVVAAVALALGRLAPLVGAPVIAILLGMAIAAARKPASAFALGIAFSSKNLLQVSIVLLGAQLSLQQVVRGGLSSLPVLFGTLIVVLALAWVLGRALGIDTQLRRLLGVGTAICGGSAIAAMASVIDVDPSDVAYALSTVFLFNVVAVIVFPILGHALALSQSAFGLWAGTAINDTSSVVAAAFAYGTQAGNDAVVVKLTRTLLIVPIVLFYAGKRIAASRSRDGERTAWLASLPWFVVWFVAASALVSVGAIPPAWHGAIREAALFVMVVALAGVGLGSDVRRMISAGVRPLLLGAALWAAIAITSLAIAHATQTT